MSVNVPEWIDYVLGYFQGVPVFFVLSGFLVWNSVARSKDYPSYLRKRFWRIFLELWGGIALETTALIIFYKIADWGAFLIFILAQSTILQFWTPDFLRGYGCGTSNGSLWTISVLIQFYVVVWFIRKLLHGKKVKYWFLLVFVTIVWGMIPHLISGRIPEVVAKLWGASVFNYLYLFLIGAFLAEFRVKILPFVSKYWYLLTAGGIAVYATGVDIPFTSYGVIKGILYRYGLIGFSYTFPKLNIKTDISYGIYIYHMTVINVMITFGLTDSVMWMLAVFAISIAFAWISTKTIGL